MGQVNIPNGWKVTTLGEVAEILDSRRVPLSSNERAKRKGKYPYYGASDIVDYIDDYIFDGEYLLISEDGENLNTRNTPIAFIVKGKFWVNNHAHILKGKLNHINKYLCWYFSKLDINPYITGAVQPKLSKSNLNAIPILMPERKAEQCAIVEVLSSLDDKIELLREENKTLENLAQTLFKEWFVHFRFPGATGKMVDSKLGKIPEGWRVGNLGEILSLEYGKALKEENRSGKGYPVLGSNGIVGFHNEFLVKGDGIVVGRKGTMGSVNWVENDFYPIDTAFFVKDKLGSDTLFFHYLLLLRQDFEKIGSDSAVPGLNRNSAHALEILIPRIQTIKYFHQVIKPLFSKIKLNNSQIKTLTDLRNKTLPKLIQGILRVSY